MTEALFSVGPVKICCPFDPSIDGERSDLVEYTTSRNPKHIVPIDGRSITWFHVRRLSRARLMEIDLAATSPKQAVVTAFREAVIRVDNLTLSNGDTTPTWVPDHLAPRDEDVPKSRRMISEQELEHFLREEIYDIGNAVLVLSNLRPGRPAFFAPLDTSARVMAENAYHRAVEIRAAASQANEEHSKEPMEMATTPASDAAISG
jgi:hypothetical protein